ncbi:uncharacterized protein EI97DRAFT_109151 [Westerdykella ornata]|uniref:Uncharacterized protein n=1 Tax=Westerdykella ornata TaxID=318751 RepID=A0A6A6JTY1_WESOR|nr:uncharacterized protein EI97DRAFT_109151 [Westerdykella ornata]KAF2280061.1 hypothetical protein EI97DRAFT_109151 [Westerdykella ornata]
MAYIDMQTLEDEVDWSDGTLDSPPARPGLASLSGAVQPIKLRETTVEQKTMTSPPALPDYLQQLLDGSREVPKPIRSVPAASLNHNTKIPQSNQNNDQFLEDAILYQANQRVYEATFIKTFVAHALDSNTLNLEAFASNPDALAVIKGYLQSVSENVAQLSDRIVWNTHYKTVNVLSKDSNKAVPFLDVDRFKKDLFGDYAPHRLDSVVQKLNQSWHRTGHRLGMVQYSALDYPLDKQGFARSPFQEIQEASRALMRYDATEMRMPKGRVFTLTPSKAVDSITGHGQRRTSAAVPPMHPTLQYGENRPAVKDGSREDIMSGVFGQYSTLTPATRRRSKSTRTRRVENDDNVPPRPSAMDTLHSFKEMFPDYNLTHLEAHLSKPTLGSLVLDRYKQQLAERGRRHPKESNKLPQDIGSIIAGAVSRNILKPPSPEVQSTIDRLARKQLSREFPTQLRTRIVSASHTSKGNRMDVLKRRRGRLQSRNKQANSKRKRVPSRERLSKRTRVVPEAGVLLQAEDDTGAENASNSHKKEEHPSGSKTLEPHQALPPEAYFEKKDENEQLAWRCGIKHPLGHYYNAGDRRACPGCNTNIEHQTHAVQMDFYMPSRTWFAQPAPDVLWKPQRRSGKPLKCLTRSHNSLGKEIFWEAVDAGATEDEARQRAVDFLAEYLKPKPKPERVSQPTPQPKTTPEPVVDLGPHPSGSTTMELGQSIPECAYFEKANRDEVVAWRCDSAHALGRYYMAGDKRSCPGCGSHIRGPGKRTLMDFYMPAGAVVRQETHGPVKWKPRRPYKRKTTSGERTLGLSHNQIAARKVWKAVDEEGLAYEEALAKAIRETDEELDRKYLKVEAREEDQEKEEDSEGLEDAEGVTDDEAMGEPQDEDQAMAYVEDGFYEAGYVGDDFKMDNAGHDPYLYTGGFARKAPAQQSAQPGTEVISLGDSSSDDDSTSGSDTE